MAIRMQGAWTVSVKAKNAAFQQRFIVEGAAGGNGTFNGVVSTSPVFVTGEDWTVRVEHKAGSVWKDSEDQITFPVTSGGQYQFDIESNDSGADSDFNDLILTCSMPVSGTDFLLFGTARSYRGPCIFNPCFPRFVVIDNFGALTEALKYPHVRDMVKQFYPERLKPLPPDLPDPPPFKPIVFSLEGDTPIPPKETLSVRLSALDELPASSKKAKTDSASRRTITSIRSIQTNLAAESRIQAAVKIDRIGLASLVDRLKLSCDSDPLAGVVLRFQEYDRTGAELAGGAYSGAGLREDLGVAVTDRNGNYIFRFTRTIDEFFDEAAVDTAAGETEATQSAPDIIVQVLDVMAPGSVLWESAPYWNIPNFKRINLCVPEVRLHPTLCVAGQVIQAVGNVFIGPAPVGPRPFGEPAGYGARVGFNNSLGLGGRITARNTSGPQARCAAWRGTLDLFGCFLDHPSVTHCTIRYRQFGVGGAWTPFSHSLRHPLIAKAGLPGYNGELIGPHTVGLKVDGGPKVQVPAYLNIESNIAYVSTHRDRRAQIRTWLLSVPTPGPVQFWIEGYNGSGNQVAGAEDSITVYIDNSAPFRDIADDITMAGTTLGNCAKFNLPAGQPGAPLTVSFKVDQANGFLSDYTLSMNKGSTGSFAVQSPSPPPFRTAAYVHGDDLVCNEFRGTFDDPMHDLVTGYVAIDLAPTSGQWLEPGQTFCAFSVNLRGTTRVTNGYGGGDDYNAVPVLIGIEA